MVLNISIFLFLISTECVDGWFGEECNHQCSGHCRDNIICNYVTGHCERGCSLGWTGYRCEKGSGSVCMILLENQFETIQVLNDTKMSELSM